jgi:D-serine deaminase-like pyridoxal phosphate-dependent protein
MNLGPNEALIGAAGFERDLATPALLLDLDAFEANLRAMADFATGAGRKLRPHVKAHKSTRIGRRQLEADAVGLCCATVLEAETMASVGLDGVLVTTPVVAPRMVERLVAARERVGDLAVVVDCEAGVDALAASARPERPIGVLVDIDMGQSRTGVTDAEGAVRVARRAAERPGLLYRGVQAYYGHLQHVPILAERREKLRERWIRLGGFLDALRTAGLPAEIVSGGGTGTHHLDLTEGPFTEIQAGSYLFMDKQYGAVELAPGGPPFRTALTVATRVVSTVQPNRVIVDAGFKAMATDAGPALVASGAPADAAYLFMGDEHGGLRCPDAAGRPELGALVTLVAPHCDPTVNLHNWLHVCQGGRLVDIWPIEARGY